MASLVGIIVFGGGVLMSGPVKAGVAKLVALAQRKVDKQ
jgi:hypothetical protein